MINEYCYFFLFLNMLAHQEALKKEIERLRQIYQQQNLQKMGNTVNDNGRSFQAPPHSHPSQPLGCTEEQLLC